MASSVARGLLRTATGDLHETLDGLLSRTDFGDIKSYAAFLLCQAAPLFAVEAAISAGPLGVTLSDWSGRRRSAAIARDLDTLGAPRPMPAACPDLAGRDEALGALYVLEGSRLGAKFLVRHARASADAHVRAATAYLAHGETEPFWQSYLKLLAAEEADGLDNDALVAGARSAFDVFIVAARNNETDMLGQRVA